MAATDTNNLVRTGSRIALAGIVGTFIYVLVKYFRSGEFDTRTLFYGAVIMGIVFLLIRIASAASSK